tara:strand:+ start:257 stop:403 length:147 start_codon:yes stop_codon:yes gene_type:complete
MTKEDDKYRQGRSKKRYRASSIAAGWAWTGTIIILLYHLISNLLFRIK